MQIEKIKETIQAIYVAWKAKERKQLEVSFVKKDGTERFMKFVFSSARTNGKVGGVLPYDPFEKNLLPVQDIEKYYELKTKYLEDGLEMEEAKFKAARESYRVINLETLQWMKWEGIEYSFRGGK